MTSQIAKDTLTLEERTLPPIGKKDKNEFKDIDQLARVLRGGEDITQSSIQRFYPGLVGLAITDIEDELTEPRPNWETKGTQTKRVNDKTTNQLPEIKRNQRHLLHFHHQVQFRRRRKQHQNR